MGGGEAASAVSGILALSAAYGFWRVKLEDRFLGKGKFNPFFSLTLGTMDTAGDGILSHTKKRIRFLVTQH